MMVLGSFACFTFDRWACRHGRKKHVAVTCNAGGVRGSLFALTSFSCFSQGSCHSCLAPDSWMSARLLRQRTQLIAQHGRNGEWRQALSRFLQIESEAGCLALLLHGLHAVECSHKTDRTEFVLTRPAFHKTALSCSRESRHRAGCCIDFTFLESSRMHAGVLQCSSGCSFQRPVDRQNLGAKRSCNVGCPAKQSSSRCVNRLQSKRSWEQCTSHCGLDGKTQ